MPSDKRNSITAKAMGLISSLFNVASSRDVPFRQPLQLQSSHHGFTKAYLCYIFAEVADMFYFKMLHSI